LESLSNKSDKALVNTKGRQQVDSGGNREELDIRSSEELASNSSKDNLA